MELTGKKLCLIIFGFFLISNIKLVFAEDCQPELWPKDSLIIKNPSSISSDLLSDLHKQTDKFLTKSPHAIKTLISSGVTDTKDPSRLATLEAVKDADHAALMALMFRMTHKDIYLQKTRELLLAWAGSNEPTGNPIDETKLAGMIWAYDLAHCDLNQQDQNSIKTWFKKLHDKKIAFTLGKKSINNNHHTHQLKMLLLLDKVLNDQNNWKKDYTDAEKFSKININLQTGETQDYQERTALYYHNYDLQPWIEITLISDCCKTPVMKAFQFLSDRIHTGDYKNEFSHSTAPIDKKRAEGGFEYAKSGGVFDLHKAAPTIVAYYTLINSTPDPMLWNIVVETKPSPWLTFLTARRALWSPYGKI